MSIRTGSAAALAVAMLGVSSVSVELRVTRAVAAPTCFGKAATIVGTNRDDSRSVEVMGSPGDDVIVDRGGSDVIDGRGGDDLICAGGGDDFIRGGPGNDKIKGGDGIEDIWGDGGHDRIWGGRGPAEGLHGDRGNDRLFGGAGTEDYLFGGPGDDALDGGRGKDLAMYPESPGPVHADLAEALVTGDGTDRLVAIEMVYGSSFDDVLMGDDDPNVLAGGPGNDEMRGGGGDDLLRSGWGGDDILDGGGGLDTANYYLSWDPVAADLATGVAITSGTDTLIGITNLVGSKYDDTLIGNDQDNLIHGSRGNDAMDGGDGTDIAAFFDSFEIVVDLVQGTATEERGSDTLSNFEDVIGSSYDDTIVGDDGPNTIWGDRGADSLFGADGDDTLMGERGSDNTDGGEGTDVCEAETESACELDPIGRRTRKLGSVLLFGGKQVGDVYGAEGVRFLGRVGVHEVVHALRQPHDVLPRFSYVSGGRFGRGDRL